MAEDTKDKIDDTDDALIDDDAADESAMDDGPKRSSNWKETVVFDEEDDKPSLSVPVAIAIAVACAVVGLLVGKFALGGGSSKSASSVSTSAAVSSGETVDALGVASVGEGDLDSAIATYTYNGDTYELTIREAIESASSLDSAKLEDGTYTVPSADTVINKVRTDILTRTCEEQGLTVSDEELDDYTYQMTQMTDYSQIASALGVTEDQAKALLRQSAQTDKLKEKVLGTSSLSAPTQPTSPEEGQESTPTAEYAQYIIGLAGDEWDSDSGTWKDSSGEYASALSSYDVTSDSATYEAATAAYQVAYTKYQTEMTTLNTEWSAYINEIMEGCAVSVGTLGISTSTSTSY